MSEDTAFRIESYVGFVEKRGEGFRIDRKKKLGSIVANEMILHGLRQVLREHFDGNRSGKMLDAGAGTRPYSIVYHEYFATLVSTDVTHSEHDIAGVNVIAPLHQLPFEDATFDFILCTEVLEHVPDPFAALAELHRVLKPGGILYLTTPFMHPLHEMPYDFFRYTPPALRSMGERTGLDVKSLVERGDYFVFALGILTYPIARFWMALGKLTRLKLYHPYNPFVYLAIVLPQLIYLAYWRRVSRASSPTILSKLYNRLKYVTAGYLTVFEKPTSPAAP